MRTFFLPPEHWCEPWRLSGQEAKHLVKVLRIQAGETIRLMDGLGREGIFSVTSTGRNDVFLAPESIIRHEPPQSRVTLALGYTKALRRSWLLEKAVELEAGALWFWQGEYSQVRLSPEHPENWRRQMEAGAKQSLNPWLPELESLPGGVSELASRSSTFKRRYLLWEDEGPDNLLDPHELAEPGNSLLALGPEGGFSPHEVSFLRDQGFCSVSLGRRILRWETAALLCLGLAWHARQQVYCND